jgi:AcrR family transcriptional regulator
VRTRDATVDAGRVSVGGRARRDQLVECAVQALCEVGFAGASIGEVARRAGVSKGVVTYHFRTKDDLLRQVVGSLYEHAGDRIAERVTAADSVMDALLGYIETNLAFVAERAEHVRAVTKVVANLLSKRCSDPGECVAPSALHRCPVEAGHNPLPTGSTSP